MTIHEYENRTRSKYEFIGYFYSKKNDKFYKEWENPMMEDCGMGTTRTDFNDEIVWPDDMIFEYFKDNNISLPNDFSDQFIEAIM